MFYSCMSLMVENRRRKPNFCSNSFNACMYDETKWWIHSMNFGEMMASMNCELYVPRIAREEYRIFILWQTYDIERMRGASTQSQSTAPGSISTWPGTQDIKKRANNFFLNLIFIGSDFIEGYITFLFYHSLGLLCRPYLIDRVSMNSERVTSSLGIKRT